MNNKGEIYEEIAELFSQLSECFKALAIDEQYDESDDESEWGEEDE